MGDVVYFYKPKEEHEHMLNIFDVAEYFLSKDSMDHKKLQKICYYAQAWYFTLYDKCLMDSDFEAWVHGPVSRQLYQKYKYWGLLQIPQSNKSTLQNCTEERSFLDKVYKLYGEYSGNELEEVTHSEPPWINARKGYKRWEACSNIIKYSDIKEYYNSILRR